MFAKKEIKEIMVESAKKQWYVLHTYSGFEDKVRSDLLSRAQSLASMSR